MNVSSMECKEGMKENYTDLLVEKLSDIEVKKSKSRTVCFIWYLMCEKGKVWCSKVCIFLEIIKR